MTDVTEQIRRDAECCPNCTKRGELSHPAFDTGLEHDEWDCENPNCRVSLYYVRTETANGGSDE